MEEEPASAAWVTGVIWDERHQVTVGRAGYHGPPDPSGMVEIGYADHRYTLRSRAGLAPSTGKTGDIAAATEMFAQLLTSYEQILGSQHPDTLATDASFAYWTAQGSL